MPSIPSAGVGTRKAAETHQGHGHRDLRELGQLPDFVGGIKKIAPPTQIIGFFAFMISSAACLI